ncbi:MAG TPA: rod shape-determining protein MreC, partial [Acidimicrobiales bacterium]|nr:rod shape-determining protein MreC [Acidimicrobiales bacterium]
MVVYRRSARPRFVLLLLILTAATVVTLDYRGDTSGLIRRAKDDAREAFAPVQSAADAVLRPFGNFFDGVLHYGDLKSQNARLREENAQLRGEALQAGDAARENRELHDQLGIAFAADVPRVYARVVGSSLSNFEVTVQIDKGRDGGVDRGMPVVSGEGLVGKVVDASGSRSTVMLLTDPSFNVGVRLGSTGDVGVAAGTGAPSRLRVDLVEPGTKVGAGDVVVTSGLQESVFPPGIPVGRVASARFRPGALQQDVELTPLVDLRRLE